MNRTIIILLAIIFFSGGLQAQEDITGKWKTIDDNTNEPRSIVEIYQKNGEYYGNIIKIFTKQGEDPDPVCEKCTDYRKNKKVIGMEIISSMKKDGDEFSGGKILDPEDGNLYRCKIWLDNEGNLKVRGYLFFFYRTQTWLRV